MIIRHLFNDKVHVKIRINRTKILEYYETMSSTAVAGSEQSEGELDGLQKGLIKTRYKINVGVCVNCRS